MMTIDVYSFMDLQLVNGVPKDCESNKVNVEGDHSNVSSSSLPKVPREGSV